MVMATQHKVRVKALCGIRYCQETCLVETNLQILKLRYNSLQKISNILDV